MRKQRYMDLSTFICPECGKTFPIMRPHGKHREKGHIKDIWCPFCKAERKFLEISKKDYYVTATGAVIY